MKRLIIPLMLLASAHTHAQSIGPTTINASGGSAVISGNTHEWAVAENTVVSTYSSSSLILTQGVLQPMPPSTGISKVNNAQDNVRVFPNPVQNELYLQCEFNGAGTLAYTLQDITGKLISRREEKLQTGNEKITVSFDGLATGNYMLSVMYTQSTGTSAASFKISKTQ